MIDRSCPAPFSIAADASLDIHLPLTDHTLESA